MSKLIALGDTHGHTTWKQVVEKHKDADKIVFIGDYVDSFVVTSEDQLNNLLDIIQFKKDNQDKVVLIIGNHDHHYWPGVMGEHYSGYQLDMSNAFKQVYTENKDLFQICYQHESTMFSHAGISKDFLIHTLQLQNDTPSEAHLNKRYKDNPNHFNFLRADFSGYGQHPEQSCIWIRPNSLFNNRINLTQVVGHTPIKTITPPSYENGIYFIDVMHQGQYLSSTDGVFQIEYIEGFIPSSQ